MKVVIIGAGFAGACLAWMLRRAHDADVVVLERSSVAGGMLQTLYTDDGVPYEYGPRVVSVFRGTHDALTFVSQFLDLQPRVIYQGTRLLPEYPVIPFPVDRASVRQLPCGAQIERELAHIANAGLPPDESSLHGYLVSTVGATLTELAFAGFNFKFWGRHLADMPAEWGKLRRLERIAEAGDYRLPSIAPHYYPKNGFNPLFVQLLEDIPVQYGVDVELIHDGTNGPIVRTSNGDLTADVVISTAPIDAMLDFRFGPLEWRGYRVEPEVVDGSAASRLGTAPDGIPFAWLYTPWAETPVNRTTDFAVIHHGHAALDSGTPSVMLREIVDDDVRMYPVWWEDERFYRYLTAMTQMRGVVPLGRLGLYKYITIDTTYEMVRRLLAQLESYLSADAGTRFEIMREVRGDWAN